MRRSRNLRAATVLMAGVMFVGACGSGGEGDRTNEGAAAATTSTLPAAGAAFAGSSRFVTDEQGRVLVLHGLNVNNAAKSDPDRVGWVTRADIERMADDWGFNAARHLIFWDAVEPVEGTYDEAYLDRVEERLDWYAAAGIHVILDMHQDIYSAEFDGDGAPPWAIVNGGIEFTAPDDIPFTQKYLDNAVAESFKSFWENAPTPEGRGLQEAFASAWQHVIERLGDHPAVVGYDILNEPNLVRYPALQAFTQRMIDAIREVDDDGWIFFEPISSDPGFGRPIEFESFDDPRPGTSRLVYAPHLYEPAVHEGAPYDPASPFVAAWAQRRRTEVQTLDTGVFIGEFGVGGQRGAGPFLDDITAAADSLLAGWAYWSYDPGGWGPTAEDGTEQDQVDHLVRAYPSRVSGEPTLVSFDPDTSVFVVSWTDVVGVVGPTEIVVPDRRYPDGFEIATLDGDDAWSDSFDAEREVVTLTTESAPSRSHVFCVAPDETDCPDLSRVNEG